MDGRRRVVTDYVWPPTIRRHSGPPLIYLDLNQWVYLAQAASGHPHGARHQPVLDAMRRLVASGGLTVAISATTYMEMSAITDPRQRRDLAEVIEELTGFNTLLSAHLIVRLEVEAQLDERVGRRTMPYAQLQLVGTGVGHALGIVGQLRVRDANGDTTDKVRARWPDGPDAFDAMLARHQLESERQLLRGPSDDEEPELRSDGWYPEGVRATAEKRSREEAEQAERLRDDDEWRRGRIRDVVAVRYLTIEALDYLNEGLAARPGGLPDPFHDRDTIRSFVDAMPAGDARVSLLTARHRNTDSSWTANDIYDLDAMSVAAAYCDVVVCEKHTAHLLRQEGIADRLGTIVLTPTQLGGWLDQQ
jgi:hypothetical protein